MATTIVVLSVRFVVVSRHYQAQPHTSANGRIPIAAAQNQPVGRWPSFRMRPFLTDQRSTSATDNSGRSPGELGTAGKSHDRSFAGLDANDRSPPMADIGQYFAD
jgi:hypothetical protein